MLVGLAVGLGCGYFGSKLLPQGPSSPKGEIDSKLVGSWVSQKDQGCRLIFHLHGEVSVTHFGGPQGSPGFWWVIGDQLFVMWRSDDDAKPVPRDTRYTLSQEGRKLRLSLPIFGKDATDFSYFSEAP